MPRFGALIIALSLTLSVSGLAQLQTPAEFLGYEMGEEFTPHYKVVNYFRHVADSRDNITLHQYGETYEGRPLVTAIISSPENASRIEDLREANLKRAGIMDGAVGDDNVAIVWLSYNVHGNESVSTEASMKTLYDMANPDDARTQEWLKNTIVIMDPCINPDGRDRYVNWYKETRGRWGNPNPDGAEHAEPWPGGRTNHYLFDLNRDWAWQVQQESQQRVAWYRQWMPQVHVDFHEQGINSPYFFAPAAEPYHEVVTDWQREYQKMIGQNHARYFDANGWLYFTREVFDLLYPSYGDTWPTFNGAIGMTYEQAGGGRAGLGIKTATGDTLRLIDRIDHHYTTGLSTVEITSVQNERVLKEFADYYAAEPTGPYKSYVIKAGNDGQIKAVKTLLDGQGIRWGMGQSGTSISGFNYQTGQQGQTTLSDKDLVVSVYQPASRLVKVLFEPEAKLADSLTYDITAWALPYAYGLDAYATGTRLTPVDPAEMASESSTIEPGAYAYITRWKSFEDQRFLARCYRENIRVRVAQRPFEMDGVTYQPGTLIILRTDNRRMAAFEQTLEKIVDETGQDVTSVSTGLVTSGSDFGASSVRFLERPEVGVVYGESMSNYAVGEVWHFFDRQLEYPVTLINSGRFGGVDLSTYDVLVLPRGSYSSVLPESQLTRLKEWVRQGGRLVAMESAAGYLAGKDGFGLKEKKKEEDESDDKKPPVIKKYGERERDRVQDFIPGSVFSLSMDNTHPLAFGYGENYFTLRRSPSAYQLLDPGWNVGTLTKESYRTGFTGSKVKPKLEEGLIFGVQEMGRGQVVYMADNPLFRGFWHAGKLLFGNAVFMVR